MPKKFSENEIKMIHEQLLTAGKNLFEQHGFKRTSIDQIVFEVGIAKGSFYKFFKNKESLFFYILDLMERQIYKDSIAAIIKDCQTMSFKEAFKRIILSQFHVILNEPLMQQSLDTSFVIDLWNKLSEADQMKSVQLDIEKITMFRQLASQHHAEFIHDDVMTSGILRSLVFNLMHPELMGNEVERITQFWIDTTIDNILKEV